MAGILIIILPFLRLTLQRDGKEMRPRALRTHFRQTKMRKRLKLDWNQHSIDRYEYNGASIYFEHGQSFPCPSETIFHCPCFYSKVFQGRMNKLAGGRVTNNPRHHPLC